MRLIWITIGLLVFFLLPFLLIGDTFEAVFTLEGTLAWLRGFGPWTGLAAVLLIVSDLLLPVPATIVMAALGMLYGPFVGGLIAFVGTFAAGFAAYAISAALGRPAALYIVEEHELERGEALFDRWGGWMVALSRWLPIFPEAIACLAGLVRMPMRTYLFALACGTLPLGFTFATVGHLGVERPVLAIALSALIPLVLWLGIRPWVKRSHRSGAAES